MANDTHGIEGEAPVSPSGVVVGRLKRRADFLATGRGARVHEPSFTLQVARRVADDGAPPRVGFTVTKKTGNAVERNRIRRRLREAVRLGGALQAERRTDYVLVARRDVMTVPFETLVAALAAAVRRGGAKLARPGANPGKRDGGPRRRGKGAGGSPAPDHS